MGNFIGSNLFEPEPDQNQGPVQGSGIWLNRTLGPVHGSQKSCENRTDPNRGITMLRAEALIVWEQFGYFRHYKSDASY